MSETYRPDDLAFLSDCFAEAENIDQAIQAGITGAHFSHPHLRNLWGILLDLRGSGKHTDESTVYAEASNRGILPSLGGAEGLMAASEGVRNYTSLSAPARRAVLIDLYAKREAYRLLQRALGGLKDGTVSLDEVRGMAEKTAEICMGNQESHASIPEVIDGIIEEATARIEGREDKEPGLTTGLPTFDRYATKIRLNEYIVVGGRSSHGKSSLMMQIAYHNLRRGQRVAIFGVEPTCKMILNQMAAQAAAIDLRQLDRATREQQAEYMANLRWLQRCDNLLVFDKDMTMGAIESRCRLIARSFKPGLTIIDQLNNVVGHGKIYEVLSEHSKALIPVCKALGGALMVGAQLGRDVEKEKRPPVRTDFRDSSSILDDAHRVIFTWRKPDQPIDNQWFDHQVMQMKLRDGPLCSVDVRFHAPTSRFVEESSIRI